METVGVQAVVQGLSKFVSHIGTLNSSLKSIEPSGNIVSRTIEGVNDWFGKLGASMLRVAEVALGVLVRDAFLAVVNGLKEIVAATIEAGNEFQVLQLRLNRLNFNAITQDTGAFSGAMDVARDATEEQLRWVQRLAATTPYDFQDIANVFTLARSYGFVDKEARALTSDISDFAAGMGLGNTEIERIIINMGQMVQQGKVTQREMNDLARGAFVPVNDIIKKMQENVGLTGKAFDKFKASGEGVNAFMDAFHQIVQERFMGASEDMARTFKGATDNVKDFIKSIFGFGIVTPVLDAIGGKIADFINVLTAPERFEAIATAAGRIGDSLGRIMGRVFNLLPGIENLADKLVAGLEGIADWIERNETKIVWFFIDLFKSIKNIVDLLKTGDFKGGIFGLNEDSGFIRFLIFASQFAPSIKNIIDMLKTGDFKGGIFGLEEDSPFILALLQISSWVRENGPLIKEFFSTLGEIVGGVFERLGTFGGGGGGLEGLLDMIVSFMEYVIANKETITEWIAQLVTLWATWQAIKFVLSIVLPPLLAIIGAFLTLMGVVTFVISAAQILAAVIAFLVSPIGLVIIAIGLIVAAVWLLIDSWDMLKELTILAWETLVNIIKHFEEQITNAIIEGVSAWLEQARIFWSDLVAGFQETFQNVADIFSPANWYALGKNAMQGLLDGIKEVGQTVLDALRDIAKEAMKIMEQLLGISSPSKVFEGYGENLMQGLALGIEKMSGHAAAAMQNAVAGVSMPAMYASAEMGGAVSTQNNYAYNYNLTVNSSAQSERVISDFNTLQSLAGG